jgi:hypothetical protein
LNGDIFFIARTIPEEVETPEVFILLRRAAHATVSIPYSQNDDTLKQRLRQHYQTFQQPRIHILLDAYGRILHS